MNQETVSLKPVKPILVKILNVGPGAKNEKKPNYSISEIASVLESKCKINRLG